MVLLIAVFYRSNVTNGATGPGIHVGARPLWY
jgi:hypothetical protein